MCSEEKKQTHFGQLQLESLYQFGIYSLTFAPTWATTNGEATNNSCPSLSRSVTIRSEPIRPDPVRSTVPIGLVNMCFSSLHLQSGQIYNLLPFLDAPKMKMSTALLLLLLLAESETCRSLWGPSIGQLQMYIKSTGSGTGTGTGILRVCVCVCVCVFRELYRGQRSACRFLEDSDITSQQSVGHKAPKHQFNVQK